MSTFIMMVGVPGSGKSCEARKLAEKYNAKIFSSDAYREKILGDENDQSNNEKVFKELHKDMIEYLKNSGSVIFDACNVSSKRRIADLAMLKDIKCVKVAYIMTTDLYTCIKQDKNRSRSVGEQVIKKFVSAYEIPSYYEGFDEIYFDFIYPSTPRELPVFDPDALSGICSLMNGFNQNNPHHKYDLLGHCIALAEQYPENCVEKEAALLHDVGKMKTQSTDEEGISHYYAHANWSTFVLVGLLDAINLNTKDEILECLFIINNHMKIRDILKSQKAIIKYKKLWGTAMFGRMVEFMRCDNKASGGEEEYGK